ncbi:heme biosynthesis HemY N-terminal domain-containing protein [Aquincola sp. MAHUQ-54]|uniref:Heme biosynthesis HemY N-terminal domain-containing protein n=1 Tax=Aquincola agrisoli TaxID=3119538 RepID=A0AAW9Q1A2_9BURK
MRSIIWLVLLFVVAVVAASTLGRNDGLVTFYWSGWRLDLSLNLFVVGLMLLCFALVSAISGVNTLIGLPARAREWRMARRERAAQAALRESLAEFLGARYGRAQKAAQRALSIQDSAADLAPDPELRVLAHLLAASSLHRLQDRARRDEHLAQALRQPRRPGLPRVADEGAQLLAAEWALDDRDGPRALQLLSELPPGVARRTQALRLRLQAQRQMRQPLDALRSARLLAKHQGFSPVAAQGLLRSLAFEAIDATHDADQLRTAWLQLEPGDRRDPYVAARAATRAASFGRHEEGRQWLKPFWEQMAEWGADGREHVARALCACLQGIGSEWLPRLEAALLGHAHEPAVVLAVGAAFAERQLWGKARRPLEQAAGSASLDSASRRLAWRMLARVAREEGDEARAVRSEQAAATCE